MTYPSEKVILDVCCGGRMMWFEKEHPNALYVDKRIGERGFMTYRPRFEVMPDIVGDFRALKFEDESFSLVVFDPPPHHPAVQAGEGVRRSHRATVRPASRRIMGTRSRARVRRMLAGPQETRDTRLQVGGMRQEDRGARAVLPFKTDLRLSFGPEQ